MEFHEISKSEILFYEVESDPGHDDKLREKEWKAGKERNEKVWILGVR